MSILKTDQGLTLMEMVVVVFLLALLAAVVYPSLSIHTGETKRDIHRMASLLRYVRDTAIYQKKSLMVEFDLKNRLVRYESPEGEKKMQFKELTGIKTPSHGLVTQGQLIVVFNLLGQAEPLKVFFTDGNCVEYNPYSQMIREIECDEKK